MQFTRNGPGGGIRHRARRERAVSVVRVELVLDCVVQAHGVVRGAPHGNVISRDCAVLREREIVEAHPRTVAYVPYASVLIEIEYVGWAGARAGERRAERGVVKRAASDGGGAGASLVDVERVVCSSDHRAERRHIGVPVERFPEIRSVASRVEEHACAHLVATARALAEHSVPVAICRRTLELRLEVGSGAGAHRVASVDVLRAGALDVVEIFVRRVVGDDAGAVDAGDLERMAGEVQHRSGCSEHGAERAPIGVCRERATVRHHSDVGRNLDLRAVPCTGRRVSGKVELASREGAVGAFGSAGERARAGVRLEVARRAVVHAQHAVRKPLRRHEVVDGYAVLGEAAVVEALPGTAIRRRGSRQPWRVLAVLVHREEQSRIDAVASESTTEVLSVDPAGAVLVKFQVVVNAGGHNAVAGDYLILVSPERSPEIDVVPVFFQEDAEPGIVHSRLARAEDRLPHVAATAGRKISSEAQAEVGRCGGNGDVAGVDVRTAAALKIFEATVHGGNGTRHRAAAGESRYRQLVPGQIDRRTRSNGEDSVNRLVARQRVVRINRAVRCEERSNHCHARKRGKNTMLFHLVPLSEVWRLTLTLYQLPTSPASRTSKPDAIGERFCVALDLQQVAGLAPYRQRGALLRIDRVHAHHRAARRAERCKVNLGGKGVGVR